MKLAIIGATGMAGTALYKESVSRRHDVTAVVRNRDKAVSLLGSGVRVIEKDVFDLSKSDIDSFDVIINAFATVPDKAYLHLDLAAKLIALFRETESPRLFFILGAGSLLDKEGKKFLDTLKTVPDAASGFRSLLRPPKRLTICAVLKMSTGWGCLLRLSLLPEKRPFLFWARIICYPPPGVNQL